MRFLQLLGIALRSDIPLALDILPSFWKSLLGIALEEIDLYEADILTYNYTRRLSEVRFHLQGRLANQCPVHETAGNSELFLDWPITVKR